MVRIFTLCLMKISGDIALLPPLPPVLPVITEIIFETKGKYFSASILIGAGETVVNFLISSGSTLCFKPLGSCVISFRCLSSDSMAI